MQIGQHHGEEIGFFVVWWLTYLLYSLTRVVWCKRVESGGNTVQMCFFCEFVKFV